MSHGSQLKQGGAFTAMGSVEHERRKAVERVLYEGNDVLAALEEGERPSGDRLDAALVALASVMGIPDKMKGARAAYNRACARAAAGYDAAYRQTPQEASDAYISAMHKALARYVRATKKAAPEELRA